MLQRPEQISCWIWYDKQSHEDLLHWQNCLYAAHIAGANDVIETATKMYVHQGGVLKALKPPRSKRHKVYTIPSLRTRLL